MTTELLENPTGQKTDYLLRLSMKKGVYFEKKDFENRGISNDDFFFEKPFWYFHKKNEEKISEFIKPYGEGYRLIKVDLKGTETFESKKIRSAADYSLVKKIKEENDFQPFLEKGDINKPVGSISTDDINNSKLSEPEKKEAESRLSSIEKLSNQHHHQNVKEKQLRQTTPKISIKFLNDYTNNYLITPPPEMPRLINMPNNGGTKVKAFIPKGVVGMVVGAGGVGKTHFLTQLGLSVAIGGDTKFLKRFPIEKPGGVFIALGENSDDDIHRLVHKTFKNLLPTDSQATIDQNSKIQDISKLVSVMPFSGKQASFIKDGKPTDTFESLLSELKEKEPECGWSLIIIDPLSRFMGEDTETDNAAATRFVALLENLPISLKGNPTVILGHHMNKSGVSGANTDQSAARGSSALTDAVRWQANLERKVKDPKSKEKIYEENQFLLRVVKSNFTAPISDLTLEKNDQGIFQMHS